MMSAYDHWPDNIWLVKHESAKHIQPSVKHGKGGKNKQLDIMNTFSNNIFLWSKHLLSLNAIKLIPSERFQMPHPIIPSDLILDALWSALSKGAVVLVSVSVN